MKKNISINISGIIFHIEEDGYDALRKYLDSINQYFGSFEDSSEILADIESRIAEIFLSKLNEGKQVITAEDVQSLIATMGSVNDFRAAEEQEVTPATEPRQEKQQSSGRSSSRPSDASKKLFRDKKKKILGGVCAGLGHYFNIDPIWPRLLFVLAVLGTSGILLILYILLWIFLPASENLEDEPTVKKMYRDPDAKVVGGVASGVAAFFGMDIVVVRLLFVLFTIFFGTGLVVYIVLWIALPEAKTITEKMQMQGEPVTLSNIESTVKKSLNEKDQPEESTLAKIILFPFRLIAAILNGLGRVLGPLFFVIIEIIRVAIGIVISIIGVILVISLLIALGLLLGVFSVQSLPGWWGDHVNSMSLPFENIRQAFPTWTAVFAFIAAFVPALFILMIGNSIVAKRIIFRPVYGWTLLVLFFVSVVFLSFSVPQLIYTFKEDGDLKVEKTYAITGTPVLKLREAGLDDYKVTNMAIHGSDEPSVKLVERFAAQGITKINARENAGQVNYSVTQSDSVITFDSNISFQKDAKFRFQRLYLDLYLPYDKPFVIHEDMWSLIDNYWKYDYNGIDAAQTFHITKAGKLECLTCPPPEKDLSGLDGNDQFGLKDFDEVELTGAVDLTIQQGDHYSIQLEGKPEQKRLYSLNVKGETLEVDYNIHNRNFWKDKGKIEDELTELTITMPNIRKLKITGAGKVRIRGFHENQTDLALTGAWVGDFRISADQLGVEANGPVILELEGEGDFLEASLSGPAQLKASGYHVNRASIEAKGLAQARLNVTGSLEIDKDFTSSVRYTGNPEIIKHD